MNSGLFNARSLRSLAAPFGVLTFGLVLAASSGVAVAQGPPGHDYHHDDHHDNHYNDHHDNHYNNRYNNHHDNHYNSHNDWRFQNNHRDQFYSHYRNDAMRWRGRQRPNFYRGQVIPRGYSIQVVPPSYWRGAPPPPPGYQYGYYDGYVVAYDPTTRIVADVMDMVAAATVR
ncbi:MAG: hypothetical protein PW789_16065 [Edaphobacter sp.]|uniref:hypothetical protein n=1 Tax=Edaphobacter sp. TaxID=1934404 RepID=UPI002392DF2B|nr:hypothetical protein [Edaphobacter sp.]MDE1178093.1 hypothetical protein [Edaphobacter sp.]